ncbi:MAG TPA: hypothetical protein VJ778_05090 [Burkholderiales bacterium]|nr:hypothetical protein [Burkholderiales bacterium]
MPDLLPTHHCFDDAIDYLVERVKRHPKLARRRTLILVHGIAHSDAGEAYAHGWVEEGGKCWDAALLDGARVWYSVTRDEYYAARQITETSRYTIREALAENLRTHSYGPWEPRYRGLCGKGDRTFGSIAADATNAIVTSWDGEV